jgi:hypothetical protein
MAAPASGYAPHPPRQPRDARCLPVCWTLGTVEPPNPRSAVLTTVLGCLPCPASCAGLAAVAQYAPFSFLKASSKSVLTVRIVGAGSWDENPRVLLSTTMAFVDVINLLEGVVGVLCCRARLSASLPGVASVVLCLIVPHAALRFGLSVSWLVLPQPMLSLTDALPSCRSGGCFAAVFAKAPSHADALLL